MERVCARNSRPGASQSDAEQGEGKGEVRNAEVPRTVEATDSASGLHSSLQLQNALKAGSDVCHGQVCNTTPYRGTGSPSCTGRSRCQSQQQCCTLEMLCGIPSECQAYRSTYVEISIRDALQVALCWHRCPAKAVPFQSGVDSCLQGKTAEVLLKLAEGAAPSQYQPALPAGWHQ